MKKIEKISNSFYLRADGCIDIRDLPTLVDKINEIIDVLNKSIPTEVTNTLTEKE